ncbi:MAG: PH domain-containing protein [Egibacteraceae bacterium]
MASEREDRELPRGEPLHPATVPLYLVKQLPGLIPVLITGTFAPAIAAGGLLIAVIASVVRWTRFRWRLEGGALVLNEGLVTRRQRVIPLERIQAVELVRPLAHRLFGVVEVRIETVGGSKTEGRLDALRPEIAQRLRATLLRRGEEIDPRGERRPLVRVGAATIVLAGLTGGRVGVVAALLGLGNELLGDRFEQLFDLPSRLGVRGLVVLALLAGLVAFIVSVAATAVAYWGFTLSEAEECLLIRRGLLEQRFDTIPLRRIQALTVEENAVRRLLGRAAVGVVVAGRAGEAARQTGVLLPLGRRSEAFALAERVLDVPGLALARLEPMPGRALGRRMARALVVAALLAAAAVAALGARGLLALVASVPLAVWGLGAYRALGHAEHDGIVVARSGFLVRRTSFVPVARLQSLALSATPVQRRLRLASLSLQIAGPGARGDPRLYDLDRASGERLLGRLAEPIPAG